MPQNNNGKNNWALITPIEKVEREKRGYTVVGEDIIVCADCGAKLVNVMIVKEADITKKIKAQCPCGGESFIYTAVGVTYIQAYKGYTIVDMPTEKDEDKEFYQILIKVQKNEQKRK